MIDGQETPNGIVVDEVINKSIERIRNISFFTPHENIPKEWLEEQSHILLKGINLPVLPIRFLETVEEANEFAWSAKDEISDWKEAWEHVRQDFLLCADVIGIKDVKHPWYKSRRLAEEATEHLLDVGRIGKDASFRSASWAQGETVKEKMERANPLAPFMNVYETGNGLIGISNKTFGIYTPTLK